MAVLISPGKTVPLLTSLSFMELGGWIQREQPAHPYGKHDLQTNLKIKPKKRLDNPLHLHWAHVLLRMGCESHQSCGGRVLSEKVACGGWKLANGVGLYAPGGDLHPQKLASEVLSSWQRPGWGRWDTGLGLAGARGIPAGAIRPQVRPGCPIRSSRSSCPVQLLQLALWFVFLS